MPMGFVQFPKIPRLFRNITISEKIDGTNAAITVSDDGTTLQAQSRNRVITPGNDNFGFAGWVEKNREELLRLGPGTHFGEWWGLGIGRGYGLTERRFSLFNTARWSNPETRPACCQVVPILYSGPMDESAINGAISMLRTGGSLAEPGWASPEGVVIFHTAANALFKVTLEKDEKPKGSTE